MARHLSASLASTLDYRIDDGTGSFSVVTGGPDAVRHALAACHDLLSERGEAPGTSLATSVLTSYASFDAPARAAFFDALVTEFSVDPAVLQGAAKTYVRTP